MVVEIDPEGTLDPALGIGRRLPAEGRTALDVQAVRRPWNSLSCRSCGRWTRIPRSSHQVHGMAADLARTRADAAFARTASRERLASNGPRTRLDGH